MVRAIAAIGMLALAGCARGEVVPEEPAPTPVPTTPGRPAAEPMVRVGVVVDTSELQVGSTAGLRILSLDGTVLVEGGAGENWSVRVAGDQIAGASGSRRFGPSPAPLRIEAIDTGHITIASKPYRGSALLQIDRGQLSAVNVLEIEEYLLGVVPYEIGRLNPNLIEAVKAQAVAARTYAVGNLNSRTGRPFDFYATVADQVYGGLSGEDSVTNRAVRETRGEILTHAGRPIIAYYSSTCAGQTASVPEVWPWRVPQPYLKSVSDLRKDGEGAYCDTSNRYRWNAAWTGDSLKNILNVTLSRRLNRRIQIKRLEKVELTGKTQSGRAEALRIQYDGNTEVVRADSIRWVLQPDANRLLNSSYLFDFEVAMDRGEVQRVEVHGGGWGHGIGMCQVGAIGRARDGQSYRDILTAYYTDVKLDRVYQ